MCAGLTRSSSRAVGAHQTQLPNASPGEYVVLRYQTQAAGGGTIVEIVTPTKETDGSWRVSGLYGRSE
jgi:hypothetical protein